MTVADRIREYVNDQYVEAARRQGHKQFTVRAGDVHAAMSLKNKLPAVSSALGSNRFLQECRLRRISVEGPLNGSNCELTFEVLPEGTNEGCTFRNTP